MSLIERATGKDNMIATEVESVAGSWATKNYVHLVCPEYDPTVPGPGGDSCTNAAYTTARNVNCPAGHGRLVDVNVILRDTYGPDYAELPLSER